MGKGFTLVELMIVVTILGVLALFSIPAYQNYTIRAKVVEGFHLVSAAKMIVVENAALGAPLDAGFISQTTDIIASIKVNQSNGEISAIFNSVAGGKTGANSIIFIPTYGNNIPLVGDATKSVVPHTVIVWTCTGGTLLEKYRPAVCR